MKRSKTSMARLRTHGAKNLAKGRSYMARAIDYFMLNAALWLLLWWLLGRAFGWSAWIATIVWLLFQALFSLRHRRSVTREVTQLLLDARSHYLAHMQPDARWPFRIAYACNCAITGQRGIIVWEDASQTQDSELQ